MKNQMLKVIGSIALFWMAASMLSIQAQTFTPVSVSSPVSVAGTVVTYPATSPTNPNVASVRITDVGGSGSGFWSNPGFAGTTDDPIFQHSGSGWIDFRFEVLDGSNTPITADWRLIFADLDLSGTECVRAACSGVSTTATSNPTWINIMRTGNNIEACGIQDANGQQESAVLFEFENVSEMFISFHASAAGWIKSVDMDNDFMFTNLMAQGCCFVADAGTFETVDICEIVPTQAITTVHNGDEQTAYNQIYFITDADGEILEINNTIPSFGGQAEGHYIVYALNYDDNGVTLPVVGANVSTVTGSCFDIIPLNVFVCDKQKNCGKFESITVR